MERRVGLALEDGAEVIFFEMDSYGGGLEPGIEIGDLVNGIKADTDGKVRTVAYVHKKAISAGALISLACQSIVMRSGTTIGDCQAIMINPQTRMMEEAPEKIQTTVRAQMRKYAQSNGYPEILCEAMVDQEIEVHQVTFPDGTVKYLTPREIEALSMIEKEDIRKKLVIASGKLLTMSDKEAKEYGISRATVKDLDEARSLFAVPGAVVRTYETNWSEGMVRFLNSMAVSSLLMLVGMLALYMSFKIPGFGAPEFTAIACFTILFLSKYMVGLATTMELLIFAVGVVLLAVELFVIPGFGITGVAGILCILIALVLSLQDFVIPRSFPQVTVLLSNLLAVFGSLLGATLIFMVLIRYMRETPFLNRLVLAGAEDVEAGYVVGSADKRDLIGSRGVALSTLRPSGRAEIGGDTMIVVAEGEFIESGNRIVVSNVRGNRVVVTKV